MVKQQVEVLVKGHETIGVSAAQRTLDLVGLYAINVVGKLIGLPQQTVGVVAILGVDPKVLLVPVVGLVALTLVLVKPVRGGLHKLGVVALGFKDVNLT